MTKITINGASYPVSAPFVQEVSGPHPDLMAAPYEALTTERDALLRLSNERTGPRGKWADEPMAPNGSLTVREQARLEAVVRVINVHHGAAWLAGRDHAEFGFEGVDQVHGNAHHMDCGCILHSVHDHNQRGGEEAKPQPHGSRHACERHAHLRADFKAHWDRAHADNKA